MAIMLMTANIVSALSGSTIGTKVTGVVGFLNAAEKVVAATDFRAQRVPGQACIKCPDAVPFVSAGVGPRSSDPSAYVCRFYRGRVDAYLRREHAAEATACEIVVYTAAAYLADPDVQKDPAEAARITEGEATHVLVAVLGFAGPQAPLSPFRFVHNLAGGNKEAATWTAEEIATKAKEVLTYDNEWCVVAD